MSSYHIVDTSNFTLTEYFANSRLRLRKESTFSVPDHLEILAKVR